MLKRLTIHKYRNVAPGSTMNFAKGMNIVLGQNATGKTTLLNLISRCLGAGSRPVTEEFDLEYEMELAGATLTIHTQSKRIPRTPARLDSILGNRLAEMDKDSLEVESKIIVKYNETETLIISLKLSSITIQVNGVDHGDPIRLHGNVSPLDFFGILLQSASALNSDQSVFLVTIALAWYGKYFKVYRMDESLDYFRLLCEREIRQEVSGILLLPFISFNLSINSKPTSITGLIPDDFSSTELLGRAEAANGKDLVLKNTEVNFFNNVIGILNFKSGEIRIRFFNKEAANDGGFKVTYCGLQFRFERHDGSIITDEFLSYGQKRLLTFFYCLAVSPGVIIADELVNGLHHSWIEACIKAIGDRQAFLTSQNPLLLDYMPPFDSAEQVASSFIKCSLEKSPDGREMMRWGNMPSEAAERFYSAYQVGIEHVSEILSTRGLW